MNKIEAVIRITEAAGIVATPVAAGILTHADIAHALNNPRPGQEMQGSIQTSLNGYTLVDQKTEQAPQPEEDPIKNTLVNEAIPYAWFHPMSANGDVWSYGVILRDPALEGVETRTLSDRGNVGEIFLSGQATAGLDIKIDTTYLADYKGSGARASLWLTTGPSDVVILMDETNDKAPAPVAVVTADEKGFAGLIGLTGQFGLRIIRASGTDPVKAAFGNISNEDYADPNKRNHPSVIDIEKYITPAAEAPTFVVPAAPAEEALPEFLAEPSVSTFQDAPRNTFFLAKSSKGEGWSHFAQFSLPDQSNGVFYRDRGNVGEMFIQTRGLSANASGNLDLTMSLNPLFANDFKMTGDNNPADNRPGVWIKTQPNAKIQLLDEPGNVIGEVRADGSGFGGVALPESQRIVRTRIVLPQPGIDTDTQIQFGAERPKDRGKSSTLDATR